MQVALDSVPLLSLSILPEHEAAQELVQSTDFDDHRGENPQQLAKAMIELRSDPAIRAVLGESSSTIAEPTYLDADPTLDSSDARSQFQLNDSAEYFFNEVERTMAAGYMPNDADIIRSRVRTTGVSSALRQAGFVQADALLCRSSRLHSSLASTGSASL